MSSRSGAVTRCMSTEWEPIRRVLVVGAGLMGSGIAQVSVHNGYETFIVDRDQAFVDKGVDRMEKSLARVLKKEMAGAEQAAVEAKLAQTMSLLKRGTDPVEAGVFSRNCFPLSLLFSLVFSKSNQCLGRGVIW
ncbi:MAG: 3-hydroxyacyl-CoA dehydrogenase NAD-binding domain-containing protein [archaeon]|nr:3-hydroxyacyl-CoA dehydrogenase NAD-binding domain-containing protein [archaeon]